MSVPPEFSITRFIDTGEQTQQFQLNSFQLRLFIVLQKNFGQFISINNLRQKFYGSQPIKTEEIKQSFFKAIRENNSYGVANKTVEVLICSLIGLDGFRDLSEIAIRGLLDIDEKTYQTIYTHFENYTHKLRLDDETTSISSNDPRLLSNNQQIIQADSYRHFKAKIVMLDHKRTQQKNHLVPLFL